MDIENVYIGGWFQRTMLQLSEIYTFLKDAKSKLKLDPEKLEELRKNLNIGSLEYNVSGEEYINMITGQNIDVKIFEDGLIILKNKNVTKETLLSDIDKLTNYYENVFSPAISYIFSLGAPVPKELANIETIYPYFVVCKNSNRDEIMELLSQTDKQKYFEISNDKYDVVRGDKFYFINNKTKDLKTIERYIEEEVFVREFKGQLHRYLNIHRIVWEQIDDVKSNTKVKGKDIVKFNSKLNNIAKTINLIDGRIKQMGTYVSTREKIAKADKELEEFLAISGYKYETLRNTLEYIKSLWVMTQNHVSSAQKLFASLSSSITSRSVKGLTIVTSMTAGATIIDLFTKSQPKLSWFGLVYFVLLALIGWGSTKVLNFFSTQKTYTISDSDYEKDIK